MNARLLTILAALAAAATGCIPNDGSVRLFGLCSPPQPNASGGCLYPAKCETLALGRMGADVTSDSIDGPLVWPLQIDNQRPSNATRDGAVETAYARVQGFKIKYASATLAAPDQDAKAIPGEATIEPGGSAVLLVPVITPAAATFLSAGLAPADGFVDVTAEIRAYGQYGDHTSFETGPFVVQASICSGCIPSYSTSPGSYCPDPAKPILTGVCPQERQSAVVVCEAPPTP